MVFQWPHLFIPTLGYNLTPTSPEFLPSLTLKILPAFKCDSCLKHLFRAGGGQNLEEWIQLWYCMQLQLTKASCRQTHKPDSSLHGWGHPEAIAVGVKLLWHIPPQGVRRERNCPPPPPPMVQVFCSYIDFLGPSILSQCRVQNRNSSNWAEIAGFVS